MDKNLSVSDAFKQSVKETFGKKYLFMVESEDKKLNVVLTSLIRSIKYHVNHVEIEYILDRDDTVRYFIDGRNELTYFLLDRDGNKTTEINIFSDECKCVPSDVGHDQIEILTNKIFLMNYSVYVNEAGNSNEN